MKPRLNAFALSTVITVMACGSAYGQTVATTSTWEQPYGAGGQSSMGSQIGAAGRDENGNRVIIDGLMQTGVGVNTQRNAGAGNPFSGGVGSSATAIGNQLNVNVVGSWNTVVVNSNQVNNGDIIANSQSSVPNEDSND